MALGRELNDFEDLQRALNSATSLKIYYDLPRTSAEILGLIESPKLNMENTHNGWDTLRNMFVAGGRIFTCNLAPATRFHSSSPIVLSCRVEPSL